MSLPHGHLLHSYWLSTRVHMYVCMYVCMYSTYLLVTSIYACRVGTGILEYSTLLYSTLLKYGFQWLYCICTMWY